jgi:hypothetical protein
VEVRNEIKTLPELKIIPTLLFEIFGKARRYCILKFKNDVIIDNIYRSDVRQREILKKLGIKYYPSPHSDYRGLDFIIKNCGEKEHKECANYINELYPYGKPGYLTALDHNIGLGLHIHLQVKPGTL